MNKYTIRLRKGTSKHDYTYTNVTLTAKGLIEAATAGERIAAKRSATVVSASLVDA